MLDNNTTNLGTARNREHAALLESKVTMLARVPSAATLSALHADVISTNPAQPWQPHHDGAPVLHVKACDKAWQSVSF